MVDRAEKIPRIEQRKQTDGLRKPVHCSVLDTGMVRNIPPLIDSNSDVELRLI
jgi:hypothetical protein